MFHAAHCNHSCTHESNHSCDECKHSCEMSDSLSSLIKAVREKAGDSPAKAAVKIGISRQGYVKWEQGDTSNMKLSNLLTFCDKYGVPVEKLLRGTFSLDEPAPRNIGAVVATAALTGAPALAIIGNAGPRVMDPAHDTPYNIDEDTLLKGFRVADQGMRRAMLALAREATEVFEKRSEQNN